MSIKPKAKKKLKNSFFMAENRTPHEVNEKKYLIDILNPTAKNTKYHETPPNNKISNIQIGRILLQTHQIISLVNSLGYSFKDKNFLDIGCGNGMIPRLISSLTSVKYSYGIDPYLDGEHTTSWPKHNQFKVFTKIIKFLSKDKFLDFLAIESNQMPDKNYEMKLIFSGDSIIKVVAEVIEVTLDDQNAPWSTKNKPKHKAF